MRPASYFYSRAEQELHMAQRATCPEAVKAHYDLANLYLERLHEDGLAYDEPSVMSGMKEQDR